MDHVLLRYAGDGKPSDAYLTDIKGTGVEILYAPCFELIEVRASPQQVESLREKFSQWIISFPTYYGIPEIESLEDDFDLHEENNVSQEFLSQLAKTIRRHITNEGNSIKLVKLLSMLTSRTVKWHHILGSIHQAEDICEDGYDVWIVEGW